MKRSSWSLLFFYLLWPHVQLTLVFIIHLFLAVHWSNDWCRPKRYTRPCSFGSQELITPCMGPRSSCCCELSPERVVEGGHWSSSPRSWTGQELMPSRWLAIPWEVVTTGTKRSCSLSKTWQKGSNSNVGALSYESKPPLLPLTGWKVCTYIFFLRSFRYVDIV